MWPILQVRGPTIVFSAVAVVSDRSRYKAGFCQRLDRVVMACVRTAMAVRHHDLGQVATVDRSVCSYCLRVELDRLGPTRGDRWIPDADLKCSTAVRVLILKCWKPAPAKAGAGTSTATRAATQSSCLCMGRSQKWRCSVFAPLNCLCHLVFANGRTGAPSGEYCYKDRYVLCLR